MVPSTLIRNDLLKSIYIGMLETLSLEETRNFWKQHPLTLNEQTLSESALLHHIWAEKALSPLNYLTQVLESLEPFLLEKGKAVGEKAVTIEAFVDKITYWGNRGTFLNIRFLLIPLNQILKWFFSQNQAISGLLHLTDLAGKVLVKGLTFPVLKSETIGRDNHVYTMLRVEELLNRTLTPWDGYLYSAKLLKVAPRGLGLPAFDEVHVLSDARTSESIVTEGKTERRDGSFYINGERMGKILDFSTFCSNRKLNIESYSLPHSQGVAMEKDYFCPKRKRVVLRKGCFYGADVYLFEIVYPNKIPKKGHYLFHFFEEAALEEIPAWSKLKSKHLELVEIVGEIANFEYLGSAESMLVDGHELISGKAAKIMRRILLDFQSTGKTEFTFKEFKYDKALFNSHKEKGFETYLKRLIKALAETDYPLGIKLDGDGNFTFVVDCKISLREISPNLSG